MQENSVYSVLGERDFTTNHYGIQSIDIFCDYSPRTYLGKIWPAGHIRDTTVSAIFSLRLDLYQNKSIRV